ncbi:MAG: hypothetical protein K9I74_03405 [Bacteroidales bacterium]|nr:hypothetical protein [Bacteroidales bacterium]
MKTLHILSAIIFSVISMNLFAGHEKTAHGARSSGLSYADVCIRDFWALRNNQAGLAWLDKPAAGIYFENRFGLEELNFQSIGMAYPLSFGTVGLTADYYGSSSYNETTAGLAYAMKLHENLSAGIQIDYLSTYIDLDRYSQSSAVTFELGLLYGVSDEIWVGAHFYNPLEQSMESQAYETIPSVFSMGLLFEVGEKIIVSTEAEKTTAKKASYHLGIEYELLEKTFARIGVSTGQSLFSFGFETRISSLSLQLASSMHHTLGFSPMASLIYNF